MGRAYSPTEILAKKYKTLEWDDEWAAAFDKPETSGVWFVWGHSGNGKSSFVMQLARQLAKFGNVFFNDLEEGTKLTMQNNLKRSDISSVKRKVKIGNEDMNEMSERLSKRKSAQFVIINSFQYTALSWAAYIRLKKQHAGKLLIFVSHAEGRNPDGRTAKRVKFDADLKIWIEGFKAISNGRYNPGGEFIIWKEGAEKYHGTISNK
jgi:hypothetical protein